MGTLLELSHTADVGFEVRASTLEELFELAARGLVRCVGIRSSETANPVATGEVRLSRPDLERLLVAWLRELLYTMTSERRLPRPTVTQARATDDGEAVLRATVRWIPYGADEPEREIKGVTYHGLQVRRTDGDWHSRVVLDV